MEEEREYYEEIKNEFINNEINRKVKTYSINKSDLTTYYNVGKMLSEVGKHYGEGIIKEYSKRLTSELGKKYSIRYLFDIRKFYLFSKVHPLDAQLSISHYRLLYPLDNDNEINYYMNEAIKRKLSKRQLETIIKSKEYERLPKEVKEKLIKNEKSSIMDFVKNPIYIRTNNNEETISEKLLQKLILENIPAFLEELGTGFTFIKNEYPIKLGKIYNYIDLLLYNIKYRCYVVVELKVTKLKKEHTGQIMTYMNYIDKNIKSIDDNKTVGIIICKKDNKYVIEYCSDKRIIAREYKILPIK